MLSEPIAAGLKRQNTCEFVGETAVGLSPFPAVWQP